MNTHHDPKTGKFASAKGGASAVQPHAKSVALNRRFMSKSLSGSEKTVNQLSSENRLPRMDQRAIANVRKDFRQLNALPKVSVFKHVRGQVKVSSSTTDDSKQGLISTYLHRKYSKRHIEAAFTVPAKYF